MSRCDPSSIDPVGNAVANKSTLQRIADFVSLLKPEQRMAIMDGGSDFIPDAEIATALGIQVEEVAAQRAKVMSMFRHPSLQGVISDIFGVMGADVDEFYHRQSAERKHYQDQLARRKVGTWCRFCGAFMEHKATGRPREYCSAACRQRSHRADKKIA